MGASVVLEVTLTITPDRRARSWGRTAWVMAITASKTAIEGFTASLALELADFGVQVKLVEPGYAPTTRFAANGGARMAGLISEPYAPFAERIFASFAETSVVTRETDVAEGVWRAANDAKGQLQFPAGADAVALAARRQS